jgi:hypothetical protein
MSTTSGLTAQYFADTSLKTLKNTRIDPNINLNLPATASPAPGVVASDFSVRWTGVINIGATNTFTFNALSDGGIKVIVNGQSLINDWADHTTRNDYGSIALAGGKSYSIEVDYYNPTGAAVAQLSWATPGQSWQVIPTSQFSTTVTTPAPTPVGSPNASLSAANVTAAGGNAYTFNVTYTDTVALNGATIGTGDVVVSGPNGFKQTATLVALTHSVDNKSYTASYRITPPGNTWDIGDNGAYTIALQAGQVEDSTNVWETAKTLGTFQVVVPGSPTASVVLTNVASGGGNAYSFTVTYRDTAAFDSWTIGTGDVVVTGPNGFRQIATLTGVTHTADNKTYAATYRITPPGNTWDAGDNGLYTVALQAAQVEDSANVWEAAKTLGTFQVFIPGSPTASLAAANVTTPSTSSTFTVTYRDAVALDSWTIGTGDVVVTGPNGFKQIASLIGVTHSADNKTYTGTYRINAAGGTWDAGDNGIYTVALQPLQVEDSTNVWAAARTLGTFQVLIPGSPTAALSVGNITTPGGTTASFTVTYKDTATFNSWTIGTGDVIVTGPNGYKQTATLVSLTHTADNKTFTATYRITAPGGSWDAKDNGIYTITLQPVQVQDSTGVWIGGRALGTFQVFLRGDDWFTNNIHDANLQNLVRQLDTDGSLTRNDMLSIFSEVENGGVSATEYSDLRTLLTAGNGNPVSMPDYVRDLADKVVFGDSANSTYQGHGLGNLFAGSSAVQLADLVGKWFLGNDLPATGGGLQYAAAAGSLFGSGPTITNVVQGEVSDCYFVAAVGEIVLRSPNDIRSMFIDNGDGTYTVRFYKPNGTADYVTVNRMVATTGSGTFYYANLGQSVSDPNTVLWVSLLEKAYAQVAQEGWSRGASNAANSYGVLNLGWEGDVVRQLTKDSVTFNSLNSGSASAILGAFGAGHLVALDSNNNTNSGIISDHVYVMTGYSNGIFTLYNPWGYYQSVSWATIVQNFGAWSNGNPL